MRFLNRREAGKELAKRLKSYKKSEAIIYALPRGGVILGKEVSDFLNLPLEVLVVRKIGCPGNPEFAVGSISLSGRIFKGDIKIEEEKFNEVASREFQEAKRRFKLYVGGREFISPKDKIAIIIDDGLATGLSMKAAIYEARSYSPKKIVIGVPVGPRETISEIEKITEEVIVVHKPKVFMGAIGAYYQNFDQVSDQEVIKIMKGK